MKPLAQLMPTCAVLVIAALVALPTVPAEQPDSEDISYDGEDPLANLYDSKHGIKMGTPSPFCDDGKKFIEVDWDPASTAETECRENDKLNLPHGHIHRGPIFKADNNSEMPQHICFPERINYDTALPLSGSHRPLWPKFGEYRYLPPQRWVHSLEHGAIVFLYHPCLGNDKVTESLRDLIKNCLWKYVMTPYRKIPSDMPYAFVAYGRAVLFSESLVESEMGMLELQSFIKEFALKASETRVQEDGQYEAGLEKHAVHAGDRDHVTCL